MVEVINKFVKAEKDLILEHGEEPTIEQLTAEMQKYNPQFTVQKVSDIKKLNIDLVSLDKPIAHNETSNFSDFVQDNDTISPEDVAIKNYQSQELQEFLQSTLDEDELLIICMHYGLRDYSSQHSVDQIVNEKLLNKKGVDLIKNKEIKKVIENLLKNQKTLTPEE